jgi:hypothetical protein
VSRWTPCKRADFIRKLHRLGFDGPFSGFRHAGYGLAGCLNGSAKVLTAVWAASCSGSKYREAAITMLFRNRIDQLSGC